MLITVGAERVNDGSFPSRGSSNAPNPFMLQKPDISTGLGEPSCSFISGNWTQDLIPVSIA